MAVHGAKEYLTREQAAEVLRVSVRTMARLAARREGPRYVILGGRALYRPQALEDWLLQREGVGPRKARVGTA